MRFGGTRDCLGQHLRERHISSRSGQFTQRAAQSGGEPGDGMRTAHRTLRRRHAVQENERTTLSGRGKRDRRVVLVGACGVSGLSGEFNTHSVSLPEAFSRPLGGGEAHGFGLYQQVRRRNWVGMINSADVWRRILPKAPGNVQPALRTGPVAAP